VLLACAFAIIPLAGAASGDLDLSFGNQGTVIDPLEASSATASDSGETWIAHAVVVDRRTSQIFVVGSDITAAEGDHVAVAASFSSDGSRLWHRTVPPSSRLALTYANAAVMHPIDGSLVVAGLVATSVAFTSLYVTRLAPDGTFLGTWERVISPAESSGWTSPNEVSVAVAPNGDVVVGAALQSATTISERNFMLTKFKWPSGAVDSTFGTNGLVQTDLGSDDMLRSVSVQADGKIVAAGSRGSAGSATQNFAVVRYMPDGTLDSTFGSGGIVTSAFDGIGSSVLVQPHDGKIVLGGTVPNGAMEVARFNPDGSLDASFGSAGLALISFCPSSNCQRGEAVALDTANRIVVAGHALDSVGTIASEGFAVARLLPDGSLDATFGTAGKVRTLLGNPTDRSYGRDVAIQTDGKIVVAGTVWAQTAAPRSFGLARYLSGLLTHTLTATVNGQGSISSTPPGIACQTDCTEAYADQTSVTLTATPAPGWTFASWSGDCAGTIGSTCSLRMDQDHSAAATFIPVPPTLTVTVRGRGSVSSTPPGIACPTDCSEAYASNTRVILTAKPTPGWTFTSWSGGGCSGATTTCAVTISQSQTVVATFLQATTLTVAIRGRGSVSSTPRGIACPTDCSEAYANSTRVILTAKPTPGWTFTRWSVGSCPGATTTCAITTRQSQTVTATFNLGNCRVTGTDGPDVLTGTPGDDKICGLGGNDMINGLGGDDLILGGRGDDTVFGGAGNDRIHGGVGSDHINGGLGDDQLEAALGDDTVSGGAGKDDVTGGEGKDQLEGNAGVDTLNGGGDDDTLIGGTEHDVLTGAAGRDTLQGQAGPDDLLGGAGDDKLDGGPHIDLCNGGSGTDTGVACETRIGIP
jgi:uncharacterized delta-60 repeat protein